MYQKSRRLEIGRTEGQGQIIQEEAAEGFFGSARFDRRHSNRRSTRSLQKPGGVEAISSCRPLPWKGPRSTVSSILKRVIFGSLFDDDFYAPIIGPAFGAGIVGDRAVFVVSFCLVFFVGFALGVVV